ncbi:MAG: HDIG domain-containing protein [Muribaculaceae bacterium]|nr:HDIG domain-containing protein [Muribaculaceae bacterium]
MKKIFSKINLIRIALLIGATAIILALVPRADRQSYNYELNQPWKYPLLTADFDMPILRDSTSARQIKDSIEANFIPFAKINSDIADNNINLFRRHLSEEDATSASEINLLTKLLGEVYSQGIVAKDLYTYIINGNNTKYRAINSSRNGDDVVHTYEGLDLLTQKTAFDRIDSLYALATGKPRNQLPNEVARALNVALVPDIVLDTLTDRKFRGQEYLAATGALGVIKKGQRIVDRGEIITPQIFTNLNTYQEMQISNQNNTTAHTYYYIGQGLYILLCWILLYIFLALYRKRFYANLRQMTFLVVFITLFVAIATLVLEYNPTMIYIMPFAAIPVIIMVFFDSRTALFSLLISVMLMALIATYQFQFIVMELAAGLAATFSINHLSKRSQLLRTAGITLLVYIISYATLCLATDGNLNLFSPHMLLIFLFNSLILSFAYILILIVEKLFGFTSMVTLVELSDINHPLLRRLAEEAPGTFQHVMQVSTLAAEAARAIDANTQLVRTGALYHDIGKMESPVFFTENQHGVNPHAGLDPETSARKIISHVTDGLSLANKAKLPEVIKDFISQHHGAGITKYFYNTAVNESNGQPVDPDKFRYPGPNPQSKETAIMMMADAVEAASRSLKEYSQEKIDNLVDKIIDSQIADGLLKESPLSFSDVEKIKATFKKRLANIYHTRIAYPEIKKKTSGSESTSDSK